MDSLTALATLRDVGPGALLVLVVLLILTDRLVPRRRLVEVEKQRDHWQQIALDLLGVADRMTAANEQAVQIVDQKLQPELVAEAVKRTVESSRSAPPEGGGLREAARLAAEAAARRLRGEG